MVKKWLKVEFHLLLIRASVIACSKTPGLHSTPYWKTCDRAISSLNIIYWYISYILPKSYMYMYHIYPLSYQKVMYIISIIISGYESTLILRQPDRHWDTDSAQPSIPDPRDTKTIKTRPLKSVVEMIDWNYWYKPEAGSDKRVKVSIKQHPPWVSRDKKV